MKSSILPKLYKRTSTGKVQTWEIHAVPLQDGTAEYITRHGQLDGKIQEATIKIKEGKNIGKANETTPYKQALNEIQSKWNKQKDKGYTESIPKKKTGGTKKPMLAHDYNKYGHKTVFPAFVQPKLDGIRCIAYQDKDIVLLSRMGKPFNIPHIKDILEPIFKKNNSLVLDGELYVHNIPFQDIVSWVKKLRPETSKLEYHVYDCINKDIFSERIKLINDTLDGVNQIIPVTTHTVNTTDEVMALNAQFLELGYEGSILRSGMCSYKEGYRSQELLKIKEWTTDEFKIIGAKEGIGKCSGQCIFICETKDKNPFEAKCIGPDEIRREQWVNKETYIGQMLTVKYFEMTTGDKPVPRFPTGLVVRNYE